MLRRIHSIHSCRQPRTAAVQKMHRVPIFKYILLYTHVCVYIYIYIYIYNRHLGLMNAPPPLFVSYGSGCVDRAGRAGWVRASWSSGPLMMSLYIYIYIYIHIHIHISLLSLIYINVFLNKANKARSGGRAGWVQVCSILYYNILYYNILYYDIL